MSEARKTATPSIVRKEILDCIQEILPPGEVVVIDDATNPILDLGLASVDGVDLITILSEKLEFNFDATFNPFVTLDNRARDIGQIVDVVCSTVNSRQEAAP